MAKQGMNVRTSLCIAMSLILGLSGIAWAESASANNEKVNGIKQSYSKAECDSLANLLVGQWINKAYLDELVRTKSPKKAADVLNGLAEFSINRIDMTTLGLQGLDYFHSGEGHKIELIPNDSLMFSGIMLSHDKPNTIYDSVYSYVHGEMVEYFRVPILEECVNNVLITGEYYDVDTPENRLVFSADGVVTGLDKFWEIDSTSESEEVSYYIMLDGNMSDYDRILFGAYNESGRRSCYIYEIHGDSLLIYDSYERHGGRDFKGELTYRLQRVN